MKNQEFALADKNLLPKGRRFFVKDDRDRD
jgi:hypothetical protein